MNSLRYNPPATPSWSNGTSSFNATTDHRHVWADPQGTPRTGIVLSLSLTLVVFLFIVLPACIGYRRRQRRRVGLSVPSTGSLQPCLDPSTRYLVIESWLMSKTVEPCDEVCDNVRGIVREQDIESQKEVYKHRTSSSDTMQTSSDDDDEADDEPECPICYECLQVGDLVSWSPNCGHCFHHMCIKEWLLKRLDCPFCREPCLPVDVLQNTQAGNLNLLSAKSKLRRPCFYCVKHQTIHVKQEQLLQGGSGKIMASMVHKRAFHMPSRQELMKARATWVVEAANGALDEATIDQELPTMETLEAEEAPTNETQVELTVTANDAEDDPPESSQQELDDDSECESSIYLDDYHMNVSDTNPQGEDSSDIADNV